MHRICRVCLQEKDFSDFPTGRKKCRQCYNRYRNHYNTVTGRTKNKDGSKKKHLPTYDLTGERFGLLVAVKPLGLKDNPSKKGSRASFFLCKCDCGGEKEVAGIYLKSGGVKSCGCLRSPLGAKNPHWTGVGEMPGELWNCIERNGIKSIRNKRKNLPFNITKEYIWDLFLKQDGKCALSGVNLCFGPKSKRNERTASLDRINSGLGYIIGNVQWVHKRVNSMKREYSQSEFIEWCRKITVQNSCN